MEHRHRERFGPGMCIFREGEPGDRAYVIDRGQVEISGRINGARKKLAVLSEGELFGEMALIDDRVRSATATALDETEVVPIPRQFVQDKVDNADPLLNLFLRVLMRRLRQPLSLQVPDLGDEDFVCARDRQRTLRLLELEEDLKEGLQEQQFRIYYQPIIHVHDGNLAGFEALVRWHHPERGVVSPAEFLPVAEDNGFIVPLGEWVLAEACNALTRFQTPVLGGRGLTMAINVSSRQFAEGDLVGAVNHCLRATQLAPEQIKLEITETALMDNPEGAAALLERLKAAGVKIAIDDFGTGYSSFSYLHRFPIDTLKIDRTFIQSLLTEDKSMEIVRALVDLARSLDLEVVAEGIESDAVWARLRNYGCALGQGFLFAKPLPEEEVVAWLSG